jgi:hypothetical protein
MHQISSRPRIYNSIIILNVEESCFKNHLQLEAAGPGIMSGLNVALGTKSSQEAIREMYPSISLPNPRMNYTVEAVQTEMQKKMTIQDEKTSLSGSNPPKSSQNEPMALVIAGPSGVGKGTLIEVLSS